MIIGALKENKKDENRVALTPESAELLAKLGHKCLIEKGAALGRVLLMLSIRQPV